MRILAAIVCLLSCAPLGAHDFWLEPSTFRPAAGSVVAVSLRVGEDFAGDPVPRRASHLDAFFIRDGAGDRDLIGRENADPAGLVRFDGPAWIVYRSKPWPHKSTAEKFQQFLREEGLPAVRATAPHSENVFRFAKTFVGGTGAAFDAPVGLRLELVPLTDPGSNAPLRVRVLFEGRPLPGALVTAVHRDDRTKRVSARSSTEGLVTFDLGSGIWLLKSVHLVPGPNAAWESLWTSLTFER